MALRICKTHKYKPLQPLCSSDISISKPCHNLGSWTWHTCLLAWYVYGNKYKQVTTK